jgi:hypothetical protein
MTDVVIHVPQVDFLNSGRLLWTDPDHIELELAGVVDLGTRQSRFVVVFREDAQPRFLQGKPVC